MPKFLIQVTVSRLVEADDQADANQVANDFALQLDDGFGDMTVGTALPLDEIVLVTR